jgi:hypothetical protein
MKTLHLSIIAIGGIIIIASTSVGIFVEKLDQNPEHPYAKITINGLKGNYTANEAIVFSVTVDGYGSGCGDTKAIIKKVNDSQFKSPVWGFGRDCASNVKLDNFKFDALPVNTTINEEGSYILTAAFDDSITSHHAVSEQKFTVTLPHKTSIYDTGITPMSTNVANTNFTINYNITEGNKILGTTITNNTNTVSLTISLDASSNGSMTLIIPQVMDDMIHNKGAQLVLLLDGQEVINYNETKDKVHSITVPFKQGTKQIIVASIVIM